LTRQDLQDNQDIFCLSGRKAKILIPFRGNRYPKAWGKVGYRTRNQAMQTVKPFFSRLKAGLLFLPFIRKRRKQQKNPNNPVNPVEKKNVLFSTLIAQNGIKFMTLCID